MLKNINLDGLKKRLKITKQGLKKGAFITITGILLGVGISSCGKSDDKAQTNIEATIDTNETPNNGIEPTVEPTIAPTVESTTEPSVEPTTEPVVEEVVITELTVEEFDKLVGEVEKANTESGLNLRKENLELVVYINNINIATPELVEKIESAYNYNEEDMINVYLQTMTAYNNDKLEYYNGEDTKYAAESVMFADKIDRETIAYIDSLFEKLYANVSDESKIELTMAEFNKMVQSVMLKNEELGITLTREEVEISVYQRNSKYASDEVKSYVSEISLKEGQTLETVDNNTLNIYKAFNNESKVDFELSNLEYESYYVGSVVDELEGYMRENNTINGYTKDQLTIGGLFTAKLKIDDAFAYFATTAYANEYQDSISAIAEANLEACVSRLYGVLGSKAALVNCEDEKVNTK